MTADPQGLTGRAAGWSVLRHLVSPHSGKIALLSAVSLGGAMLEASFIVLLTGIGMALVDGLDTVGPAFGRVVSVPAALALAGASLGLRVVLSLWGVRLSAQLTASVTTEQRTRLSHAFLRTNWATQHAEPAGRLQELLTSFVARITQTVSTLSTAIMAALSLIAFLGMGVAIDPVSTVAVLAALAVVGAILTPVRRAIRRRSRRNAEAGLAFANAVSELSALGLEMQTYGAGRHFEERIDALTARTTITQRRTQELQGALPHVYITLTYGAVLLGVALLTLSQVTDLAAMGSVILLMLRSLSYGQQLSTASASIAAWLPFLEDVEATVRRYAASPASSGSAKPASVVPLDVRNVAFSYSDDRIALKDVTFRLHAGEALGIIGPSGAGKSTLAQLLLGLRAPTAGEILVAGEPMERIDRQWLATKVAFVAQDAQLFTGTVAENIKFFRTGISDSDLHRAALQANILTDVQKLPEGFDTHLGERGSELSGGQRQRLSIARALAGGPDLLILDEPTSALDGQSEALIRSTLTDLHGRISVVIIAHRMSTLEICDRIMVIERGYVTALGSPTALRTENAFYRNALAIAGIV